MKKLSIIICLLIFSGCTVNYNVAIKNDNTVTESTRVNVKTINTNKEFSTLKKELNDEYRTVLKKYGYNYSISNKNNNVVFEVNKKSNIKNLFKHSLYKALFEDYELYNNENIVHFKTVGNNYLGNIFVIKNYETGLKFDKKVDKLIINISFENKVIDNNADKYDKKTNTYSWIFTKDNYNKSIKFSYDKSIKVIDINDNIKNNNIKFNLVNIVIIIVSVIGFMAVLFMFFLRRNNKINKL